MDRFFGGKPLLVILKLAIISIVVGVVFAALGINALSLLQRLDELASRIYQMGFGAVEWALQYFVLGAVVVFPIWLIARLLKTARRDRGSEPK